MSGQLPAPPADNNAATVAPLSPASHVSRWHSYWRSQHWLVLSALGMYIVALVLPPFSLFADHSSYLLQWHLILELFAVVVAILIATISWYEAENSDDVRPRILVCGFSSVAMIDLIHALTYDGMPALLTPSSTHRAIFFWLAGRALVWLTMLCLVIPLKWQMRRRTALMISLIVTGTLFAAGTWWLDSIPPMYVAGQGVTPFKAHIEQLLCALDIVLAGLFIARSDAGNQSRYFAFASASLIMATGELVFANYIAPSDFLNTFGHIFKIAAYTLLYKKLFVSAIRQPYQKIRESEERLRNLTELSADWFWEADTQFRVMDISKHTNYGSVQLFQNIQPWEIPTLQPVNFDWPAFRADIARQLPFKDNICQIHIDDRNYWISASGTPIYDEHHQFAGYRGIATDITSRKQSEMQIEYLAFHDMLTGLPNRVLLQDRFDQLTRASHTQHSRLALFFLDLDHFKKINDSLGHESGDLLLKEVATRLSQTLRDGDTLARVGGDEFLIILPDIHRSEDVAEIAEQIISSLQSPLFIGTQEVSISASIGIAIFPDDGHSFDDLRRHADMAMYRAKDSGRNIYRFYDEGMHSDALNYMQIRSGLRHAIERKELKLFYQLQFDIHSRTVIGAEALLRWQHPELGMVSPAMFIPVAEDSGLIIPISDWVLNEACRQGAEWLARGLPFQRIAVNLSGTQFRRGNVRQSVEQALAGSGLPPSHLELEVTESILLEDVTQIMRCIHQLSALGITFSIDDFGTGYSSLSYLKEFKIDKIKIDQSFVRDVGHDENDVAIVRAIIQLAHGLNMKAIAEGVETEQIMSTLKKLGCDEVQGYLLARPMPATDCEALMANLPDLLQASGASLLAE